MSPIALSLGKRSVLRMSCTEVAAELEVSPPRIRNGLPSTIRESAPASPSRCGVCACDAGMHNPRAAARIKNNLFIKCVPIHTNVVKTSIILSKFAGFMD